MFVADLHNDVLQRAFVGEDITVESNEVHSDLERLKKSCIDLEVFVISLTESIRCEPIIIFHIEIKLLSIILSRYAEVLVLLKIPPPFSALFPSR